MNKVAEGAAVVVADFSLPFANLGGQGGSLTEEQISMVAGGQAITNSL